MDTSPYNPYELGYLAAAGGLLRRVPRIVRCIIPNISSEWFRGYDQAVKDDSEERARVQAEFPASRNREAATGQ